jgi:hypothetical protein
VRLLLLIALVGLVACQPQAKLHRDGVSMRLTDARWGVAKLVEGTWRVGKLSRDIVGRNLTVILDVPALSDEDEQELREKHGVDSWMVRVVQANATASRIELGTLFVPFRGSSNTGRPGPSVRSVSFALTYAAAAMSERFRRFQCPAFSHDRRLDDYGVEGEKTPIEFVLRPPVRFAEKVFKTELVPNSLNVGHTMVGKYTFEVALYGSTQKVLHSAFTPLPFHVAVKTENTVKVDGCAGVHPEYDPAPPSRPKRLEDWKP